MCVQRKLSAILPTKGRGKQAVRCIHRFFETTKNFDTEMFVVAHPDPETKEDFKKLNPTLNVSIDWVDCSPIQGHNIGGAQAKGTHFLAFDDDAWFHDNWLAHVMKVFDEIPNNYGYVKIPSDSNMYWAERAVGSRRFYEEVLGRVLDIPHYYSQYDDVEKSDRAMMAGIFYVAEKAFIEHRTWVYGKAEMDDTYKKARAHVVGDENMYRARLLAGFPNDYEAVW
jgi:GT2 family glycosyltransferase